MNLVIEENPMELVISQDTLTILTVAQQGASGTGADAILDDELFVETPDGVRTEFTIPYKIVENKVKVFRGEGKLTKNIGYSIVYNANNAKVTFTEPPTANDALSYDAIKVIL